MKKYINWKSRYGLETVDELTREEGESYKSFRKRINYLVREYNLAYGIGVCYASQRSCNNW